MNKTPLIVAVLISVVFAVTAADASRASQETADCGRVDGVQMCLASSGSSLRLAFANVGERDVTLNLGIMLKDITIETIKYAVKHLFGFG